MFTIAVVLGLVAASSLAGCGENRTVATEVFCAECEIRVELVASLGNPSDPVLLDDFSWPARDASGRYLTGDASGLLAVYDSTGKFLRSVGRKGVGPGEFRSIRQVVPFGGDSIIVMDRADSRLTVLTSEFEYACHFNAPFRPREMTVLADSFLVFNGGFATAESIGQPLHIISLKDGSLVRSLGAPHTVNGADRMASLSRRVAPSREPGVFYSAHSNSYEVEKLTVDGSMVSNWRREAQWFPPPDTGMHSEPYYLSPPRPSLYMFYADTAGLLWVFAARSDAHWKADPAVADMVDSASTDRSIQGRFYDTVIEVIDPDTWEIVASTVHDIGTNGTQLSSGGEFFSRRRDPDSGVVILDIWRTSIFRK